MYRHINHLHLCSEYLSTIPNPPQGAKKLRHYEWIASTPDGIIYNWRDNRRTWTTTAKTLSSQGRITVSIRPPVTVCRAMDNEAYKVGHNVMPRQRFLAHRIVALCHIPNPNDYPQVRHLDGNPTNNVVSNLAWGTATQNSHDRIGHGTMIYGEDNKLCKSTNQDVLEWRERCLINGESYASVARDYTVAPSAIRLACLYQWKHIKHTAAQREEANRRIRICDGKRRCRCMPPAEELRDMLLNGQSFRDIVLKYKCSYGAISIKLKRAGLPHKASDYKVQTTCTHNRP